MRIVLAVRVYATHNRPGGMIHVCQERAEELARQGHEVHVLTTKYDAAGTKYKCPSGVTVHSSISGSPQEYGNIYAELCESMCNSLRPDVIHLDSWDKNRLWWAPFRMRCRVAVTNHGEAVGSQLTDWRLKLHGRTPSTPGGEAGGGAMNTDEWLVERAQLQQADVVIATCRFDRWLLSDLLGLKHVRLVYNPLAPYHFQNQQKQRGAARNFLCIGVWGHGERGFDVAKTACDLAGVNLSTPQNIERGKLLAHYDFSDAMLLPGFQSKGYDLSVAESVARLRPVFIADNGVGTMEAIGRPWLVPVPAGDADALAEKLRGPMPKVPECAVDEHRPESHVKEWLKAVMGERV